MSRRPWQLSDLSPTMRAQAERQLWEATAASEDLGRHVEAQRETKAVKTPLSASLPFELPSLNTWERMHWAKRNRMKEEMTEAIRLLMPLPYPLERVKLSVTRVCRSKITDFDNLAASCKPLLDSLKRAGVILDDSSRVIVDYRIAQLTLKEAGVDRPETRVELS